MKPDRLIARRIELNLTHDEVAKRANISRCYYTNIEAGRRSPSMKVAKRIANALESTVDAIFFEDGVPNRNSA